MNNIIKKYIKKKEEKVGIKNITIVSRDVNESFVDFSNRIETGIINGNISIDKARNIFEEKYPGTFSK